MKFLIITYKGLELTYLIFLEFLFYFDPGYI